MRIVTIDKIIEQNSEYCGLDNCLQLCYTLIVVCWICSVFVLCFCSISSLLLLDLL